MPRYFYKAKAGPGNTQEGVIEAADRQNAVTRIVKMGFIPLDVREEVNLKSVAGKPFFVQSKFFSGISLTDQVTFLRQLYDLVDAEIPILRAMQLVIEQTRNPVFKVILQDVRAAIENGDSLSKALFSRRDLFPPYLVAMIKAGEMSGRLKNSLMRVCELLEQQQETLSKIKSSLVYPAVILGVGFLTVLIILTFVIPRLAVMFEDLDQELPLVTRMLIDTGAFLSVFWWVPVIVGVGVAVWIQRLYATSNGKMMMDRFLLRVPLWGNFIMIQELGRLARTMGIMLENGVEIVSAMECVQGVIHNGVIRGHVKSAAEAVAQGSSLAAAFRASQFFPPAVVSMVGVGEESGRVQSGFLKWAQAYERESERIMKILTTLLEPLMILLIGGTVGFMVLAMLLPIFRMNLVIH